ncbi:hypothetical protein MCEMSEM23_01877 [Rhabdaerophilaceae bacterium]
MPRLARSISSTRLATLRDWLAARLCKSCQNGSSSEIDVRCPAIVRERLTIPDTAASCCSVCQKFAVALDFGINKSLHILGLEFLIGRRNGGQF